MTDKELIKQEIERRISQFESKYPKDLGGYWDDEESAAYDCAEEYKRFLQFIDSLQEEPISEDIENEIERFVYSLPHSADGFWPKDIDPKSVRARTKYGVHHYWSYEQVMNIARHFAEWQRKKDQETIELAEDHAMLAGMMKEREEMMKDAVEGEVVYQIGSSANKTTTNKSR